MVPITSTKPEIRFHFMLTKSVLSIILGNFIQSLIDMSLFRSLAFL